MTSTETYKKKLIEVAIPLEAINTASVREKSIRHGHPSTLHLWWARRPLAACRAVLFAQLVDDPSGHPEMFPTEESVEWERLRLFKIIEDLVIWENSTNEEILERARVEIRRSCGDKIPSIYDPFAGGGSIPLEAQRLGLAAYGSDLNPVAVMIGKAMVEIPPRFRDSSPVHPGALELLHYKGAEGLAEDVKYYGKWMSDAARSRIGHLYPEVTLPANLGGGKATVIAWMWSRTVPSPDPAFSGAYVPISSSFALSMKKGKEAWIEPVVDKDERKISFRVHKGGTPAQLSKANEGTKSGRAVFTCLFSGAAISGEYIDQCASKGQMKSILMAVVADSSKGRIYLPPEDAEQLIAIESAEKNFSEIDLSEVEIACRGTFASNALGRRYGFNVFRDYFTHRQLVALDTFTQLLSEVRERILTDAHAAKLDADAIGLSNGGAGADAYAQAVTVYLAFAVDRAADAWSSVVSWRNTVEATRSTFARQGISMVWDYVEVNPFSDRNGNWEDACLRWAYESLAAIVPSNVGFLNQGDAQTVSFPAGAVVSTDPPYYDNIAYADLSDFFYVWLRRKMKDVYPELFSTLVVPKAEELVATPYRHGGRQQAEEFFLSGMTKAITNISTQSSDIFPTTIYYAFKQSEIAEEGVSSTGWATFVQAVINAGFSIVATWPMRTEKPGRMVSIGTNALANSVVLVCRKRRADAGVVSRAEFMRALKRELPEAMAELLAASIAPADMPQSAIGPGMGVFSRYQAVLESDDSPMSVKAALQLINRELDEYLGGIQGEFDADTRFAITWFEQHGSKAGEYGAANSIAQARGISVDSVKHAGIVESSAGKVRILGRDELDADWDPAGDSHLTVWECCQHLIRALETDGEHSAALLLKKIGSEKADAVKDLAYCLHGVCEKRTDAKEATSYNALIAVWTELTRQAAAIHDTGGDRQTRLDL